MSKAAREQRVDQVLQGDNEESHSQFLTKFAEMHLTHVSDSQIGDARRKGLSGGEKKRLAIAAELITDPAVETVFKKVCSDPVSHSL